MNNKLFQTPFAYLLVASHVFLFYIVLFPFKGWTIPDEPIFQIVCYDWLSHIYTFDIIQNLLLFVPMGIFAGCDLILKRYSKLLILFIVTLASFSTSLFIEVLQTYNPVRIPSLLDISLNTISGFIGALLSPTLIRIYPKMVKEIKASILQNSFHNPWSWLGVSAWLTWALFELYPFIPTLHPNQLFMGIHAILDYLHGDLELSFRLFIYYCMLGTMLYFAGRLFLNTTRLSIILTGFISLVLLGKISVITLVLEPELLAGCFFPIIALTFTTKVLEYSNSLIRNQKFSEYDKV